MNIHYLPTNSRRTHRSMATGRAGIASFELVMSFPILVFLVAMLYTVYIASIMKSQLMMETRHTAWLDRSLPHPAGAPFDLLQADSSGKRFKQLHRTVEVYRGLSWMPVVNRDINWGNVVLTGSWDHRQVEFKKGNLIYPHIAVLKQMIQGATHIIPGGADDLGGLTSIPGL